MLLPDTVIVASNGHVLGSLGDMVIETDDPFTEPVRLPAFAPAAHVPDRLLPLCVNVTRVGKAPSARLVVPLPFQVPAMEGVDGPVGDDEAPQADATQVTRVSKNANAVCRYITLLSSENPARMCTRSTRQEPQLGTTAVDDLAVR
jgi:hypothetical protein